MFFQEGSQHLPPKSMSTYGLDWCGEDEKVGQGERWQGLTQGKFHLRERKDGCCSRLQALHLKLLRTDEKGRLYTFEEGLTLLGQSGKCVRRLECTASRESEDDGGPRGPHLGWGFAQFSLHWCRFGSPPIQATSPVITNRKEIATGEW